MTVATKTLVVLMVVSGWASQYAPGVTERVIWTRQNLAVSMPLPQKLPHVDGYIAVQDCSEIGEVWKLRRLGFDRFESFLVIDCSGSYDTTLWMESNNILVEVDHETAKRWDTIGRGIEIERLNWEIYAANHLQGETHRQVYRSGTIE